MLLQGLLVRINSLVVQIIIGSVSSHALFVRESITKCWELITEQSWIQISLFYYYISCHMNLQTKDYFLSLSSGSTDPVNQVNAADWVSLTTPVASLSHPSLVDCEADNKNNMIRELTKTTWMNPENRCSMSNPEAWQEKNIISAARLVCFTQPQCHQHLQQWERENGHAFGLMLGAVEAEWVNRPFLCKAEADKDQRTSSIPHTGSWLIRKAHKTIAKERRCLFWQF